ncbi:unnamed protein product [Amoebophrya sp. A120]|nr:unnamed protein product [Amoebophrya sp. A120]|eukprot:GSA120T00003875001.1
MFTLVFGKNVDVHWLNGGYCKFLFTYFLVLILGVKIQYWINQERWLARHSNDYYGNTDYYYTHLLGGYLMEDRMRSIRGMVAPVASNGNLTVVLEEEAQGNASNTSEAEVTGLSSFSQIMRKKDANSSWQVQQVGLNDGKPLPMKQHYHMIRWDLSQVLQEVVEAMLMHNITSKASFDEKLGKIQEDPHTKALFWEMFVGSVEIKLTEIRPNEYGFVSEEKHDPLYRTPADIRQIQQYQHFAGNVTLYIADRLAVHALRTYIDTYFKPFHSRTQKYAGYKDEYLYFPVDVTLKSAQNLWGHLSFVEILEVLGKLLEAEKEEDRLGILEGYDDDQNAAGAVTWITNNGIGNETTPTPGNNGTTIGPNETGTTNDGVVRLKINIPVGEESQHSQSFLQRDVNDSNETTVKNATTAGNQTGIGRNDSNSTHKSLSGRGTTFGSWGDVNLKVEVPGIKIDMDFFGDITKLDVDEVREKLDLNAWKEKLIARHGRLKAYEDPFLKLLTSDWVLKKSVKLEANLQERQKLLGLEWLGTARFFTHEQLALLQMTQEVFQDVLQLLRLDVRSLAAWQQFVQDTSTRHGYGDHVLPNGQRLGKVQLPSVRDLEQVNHVLRGMLKLMSIPENQDAMDAEAEEIFEDLEAGDFEGAKDRMVNAMNEVLEEVEPFTIPGWFSFKNGGSDVAVTPSKGSGKGTGATKGTGKGTDSDVLDPFLPENSDNSTVIPPIVVLDDALSEEIIDDVLGSITGEVDAENILHGQADSTTEEPQNQIPVTPLASTEAPDTTSATPTPETPVTTEEISVENGLKEIGEGLFPAEDESKVEELLEEGLATIGDMGMMDKLMLAMKADEFLKAEDPEEKAQLKQDLATRLDITPAEADLLAAHLLKHHEEGTLVDRLRPWLDEQGFGHLVSSSASSFVSKKVVNAIAGGVGSVRTTRRNIKITPAKTRQSDVPDTHMKEKEFRTTSRLLKKEKQRNSKSFSPARTSFLEHFADQTRAHELSSAAVFERKTSFLRRGLAITIAGKEEVLGATSGRRSSLLSRGTTASDDSSDAEIKGDQAAQEGEENEDGHDHDKNGDSAHDSEDGISALEHEQSQQTAHEDQHSENGPDGDDDHTSYDLDEIRDIIKNPTDRIGQKQDDALLDTLRILNVKRNVEKAALKEPVFKQFDRFFQMLNLRPMIDADLEEAFEAEEQEEERKAKEELEALLKENKTEGAGPSSASCCGEKAEEEEEKKPEPLSTLIRYNVPWGTGTESLQLLQAFIFLVVEALTIWFTFLLPLSFLYRLFGSSIFEERENKMMEMQLIYGLDKSTYWLANLVFFWLILGTPFLVAHWLNLKMLSDVLPGEHWQLPRGDTNEKMWHEPYPPASESLISVSSKAIYQKFDNHGLRRLFAPEELNFTPWIPIFPPLAALLAASTLAISVEKREKFESILGTLSGLGNLMILGAYVLIEILFPTRLSFWPTAVAGAFGVSEPKQDVVYDPSLPRPPEPCSSAYDWQTVNHILSFGLGVTVPGYSYLRIVERGLNLMRATELARHKGAESGESSLLATPKYWNMGLRGHSLYNCARNNEMSPPEWTQRQKPMLNILKLSKLPWVWDDEAKLEEYVNNAGATDLAHHLGPEYWVPVTLEYLSLVLNVLFWGCALLYAERRRHRAEAGDHREADAETAKNAVNAAPNKGGILDSQGNPSIALKLVEMTKTFDNGRKTANDRISYAVKRGEIFGLLGHNGAGKTTMVSQICGQIPVTSGDCFVTGHSIKTSITKVRQNLALCPQANPLWNTYSMRQHLQYFARLRQLPEKELNQTIEKYAFLLGLGEKLDTNCEKLSGGQKRRLWVLCSLLGSAPVVIMDEPTSGMDPQARRDFWVLLKRLVKEEQRAIIFSTHYLEEADLLADRKLILAGGKVVCIGTSQELKHNFGQGFWIHAMVDKSVCQNNVALAEKILHQDLKQIVERELFANAEKNMKQPVTSSEQIEQQGTTPGGNKNRATAAAFNRVRTKNPKVSDYFLAYSIPWAEVKEMPRILDALANFAEQNYPPGLVEFTVEQTTLEEVFRNAGELADREEAERQERVLQAKGGSRKKLNQNARVSLAAIENEKMKDLVDSNPNDMLKRVTARTDQLDLHNPIDEDGTTTNANRPPLMPRNYSFFAQVLAIWEFRFYGEYHQRLLGAQIGGAVFLIVWVVLCILVKLNVDDKLEEFMEVKEEDKEKTEMKTSTLATVMSVGLGGVIAPLAWQMFGASVVKDSYLPEEDHGLAKHLYLHGISKPAYHIASCLHWLCFLTLPGFFFFTLSLIIYLNPVYGFNDSMIGTLWLSFFFLGVILSLFPAMLLTSGMVSPGGWTMYVILNYAMGFIPTIIERVMQTDSWDMKKGNTIDCWVLPTAMIQAGVTSTEQIFNFGAPVWWPKVCLYLIYIVFPPTALAANLKGLWKLHALDRITGKKAEHFSVWYYLTGDVEELPADLRISFADSGLPDNCNSNYFQVTSRYEVLAPLWSLVFYIIVGILYYKVYLPYFGKDAYRTEQQLLRDPVIGLKLAEILHKKLKVRDTKTGEVVRLEKLGDDNDGDVNANRDPDVVREEQKPDRAAESYALDAVKLVKHFPPSSKALQDSHNEHHGTATENKYTALQLQQMNTKWATKNVTFGVYEGECFGLLGPNGAGKTTLFNLLSGTEMVDVGRISIYGQDCVNTKEASYTVGSFPQAAREKMGLAPQFDKLWPHVSGRAHLRLFSKCCGTYMREGELDPEAGEKRISTFLKQVSLSEIDADRKTEEYSGGMKRKLSVALTLITEPKLVFLDEMSAGVDIVAQQSLWRKLINRPKGQTIITTTHSMMEADATSDRIGILVGGKLKCLGSTHRIKSQYGNGYQLELLVRWKKGFTTPAGAGMAKVSTSSPLVRRTASIFALTAPETKTASVWEDDDQPLLEVSDEERRSKMSVEKEEQEKEILKELQAAMEEEDNSPATPTTPDPAMNVMPFVQSIQKAGNIDSFRLEENGRRSQAGINETAPLAGVNETIAPGSDNFSIAGDYDQQNIAEVERRREDILASSTVGSQAGGAPVRGSAATQDDSIDIIPSSQTTSLPSGAEIPQIQIIHGAQPEGEADEDAISAGAESDAVSSLAVSNEILSSAPPPPPGAPAAVAAEIVVAAAAPRRTTVARIEPATADILDERILMQSLMQHTPLEAEDISLSEKMLFQTANAEGATETGALPDETQKSFRVRVIFNLKKKPGLMSAVFRWCMDDPLQIIEDYGFGEPTLEQVFLKFAKEQETIEEDKGASTET